MKRTSIILSVIVVASMVLSACASVAGAQSPTATATGSATAAATTTAQVTPQATLAGVGGVNNGSASTSPAAGNLDAVASLENSIQGIYKKVNPSVVNIEVTINPSTAQSPLIGSQVTGALGSGFIWDKQGHIVTNNHVVADASTINVVFSDGSIVPAKTVGTDPDSDLAVIQVDVPADRLQPVALADSTKVQVGELAVAIGNPYGQNGSLSVGFVSGLGRELPVNQQDGSGLTSNTGSYIIPDIIQTDAPINPGNSGGVLVNDQGLVLGVTAAIATNSSSGSGVGFVIPSVIVQKVVPALIQNGAYQHPWVGISGTTLTPDLAKPMGLNADQRGALVVSVTDNSPASKAGLQPSTQAVTINGLQTVVGGDVIVSIDNSPIKTFDDLITFLARSTDVGQKVTLGILRDGKSTNVDLTLAARPATPPSAVTTPNNPTPEAPQPVSGGYLGISGFTMDSAVAKAMNLPTDTQGVLVVDVKSGGPAADAGLKGGSQSFTDNGQQINIGGDVITAMDGTAITGMPDLRSLLTKAAPGQKATLTILRGGKETTVTVTLGTAP
jgi:serine protease Do